MRLTRILPSLLLAALLASACTPASQTPTPTPSLPAATETSGPTPTATLPPLGVDPASIHGTSLQVWHALDGAAAEIFTSQTDQFNATNEWGITVHLNHQSDYTALSEAVGAAADSGSLPDLAIALPEQVLAWNASGSVVNLAPYRSDPVSGLKNDFIADIPSVFWTQDTVNNRLLGLPAQRSARFLFYNKTWAHELGFDAPPATAEEFRQQACAASASYLADTDRQNDGYGGWIIDTHWQTGYSWLLAFGGGAVDGSTYTFSTDPNLSALQFLKTLFDDHCAWLSTEPNPLDSFAHRSALFISGDLAEASLLTESMQRLKNPDDWTMIPFPGPQGQVVTVYGPSYTVLKSTPERQLAAWLFARWMLSPENQAQWVEATGLFPLRSSLLDMIGPFRANLPQWEEAVGDLPAGQTTPQLASWSKARYLLQDGLMVIFQVDMPVDQLSSVLTEMDSMAEEIK